MSFEHTQITPELSRYVRGVAVRDLPALARLREETATLAAGRMQICAEQGQFFQWLIGLIGARRTLEVGVFTGYSSISVALALPDDGRIIACDVSDEWTSIARRYWKEMGVEHKIDLRLGPATETLARLIADGQSATFDFAFIDADKENYDAYYEHALNLLRPGGVIAVDNVLWHGKVADPAANDLDTLAIRRLNEKIHADPRVSMSMIPIGDGLTLATKR